MAAFETPFYYAHSSMYMHYVRNKKIKLRKIKIWMNPPINIFIADAAVVLDFLLCNLNSFHFRDEWNECEIWSGDVCDFFLLLWRNVLSRVTKAF